MLITHCATPLWSLQCDDVILTVMMVGSKPVEYKVLSIKSLYGNKENQLLQLSAVYLFILWKWDELPNMKIKLITENNIALVHISIYSYHV